MKFNTLSAFKSLNLNFFFDKILPILLIFVLVILEILWILSLLDFFDVNKIFNRGTKDFDNYLVIPNKEQFAYIDVKYEQGTVYNANFKDETRESLNS